VKVFHLNLWLGIAKNAVSSVFFYFAFVICACVYTCTYKALPVDITRTSHFHLCIVLVTLMITKSFSAGIYFNYECLLQINYMELEAEIWLLPSTGYTSLSHVIEIQNGQVELYFLCDNLMCIDPQVITFSI
jgi:hypothetical protein